MKVGYLALAGAALLCAGSAQAQFVNGGFEAGNASGWTTGTGYRGNVNNPLTPSAYLPGGSAYDASLSTGANAHSKIITAGTVDTTIGAALGTTVYSGQYSWRVEDTSTGGYASVIQQRVNNYQDANIFFAWKAVLENGGHAANESAIMVITLRDLTTNTELIRRDYNATSGSGGADPRFSTLGSFYYTSQWQIEQLAIGSGLQGHDFLLTILGADCGPTGHEGYLYLDGFGNVTPPAGGVPEPATWAMMLLGFGLMGGTLRSRRSSVRFNAVAA